MDLKQHIDRQKAFSIATFGPDERRAGVCDHIRKEIEKEILPDHVDCHEAAEEWVDLVILSLDGFWRALHAAGHDWSDIAEVMCTMIVDKQSTNEQRDWPDWRTVPDDQAIEHVKGCDRKAVQIHYLNGGKIEVLSESGVWRDPQVEPSFSDRVQYRIKPGEQVKGLERRSAKARSDILSKLIADDADQI